MLFYVAYSIFRPVAKEIGHFFFVVTLAFFQIDRALGVQTVTFGIKDNENGVTETSGILQTFHGFDVFVAFGGIDVNVDKVVSDNLVHYRVLCCEISKAQAPGTPVATHLT